MTVLVRAPAPAASMLLRGARALDPAAELDATVDVRVADGVIAEIAPHDTLEAPIGTETVDAAGRHLLPGFFDPHVHLRTPGQEHKEDIETGTRAAAAGGFCAVIAMPNTVPPIDTPAALRGVQLDAERDARVAVGFLAALSRGQDGESLTDMTELRGEGALGFTDDGRPVRSAGLLRRALQYQRLCGGVVALHEEDPELSGDGVMHEGDVSAVLGLTGIPSLSESTMVARDAAIAGHEQARVHFQHLSAVGSVEALAAAKAAGFAVSGEVTPHHLLLTDDAVVSLDTRLKMNPPLRAESDRLALVEALRAGVIDCVATDHAPHAHEDKDVPFEQAAMGTTGLETAFAALYSGLVVPGVLGLDILVRRMTAGAAAFGLPPARIATGEPANMCLVDLEAEWRVGEAGYESRAANCCFAGRLLRGRVLLTIAAGAVAYRDRAFALSAA